MPAAGPYRESEITGRRARPVISGGVSMQPDVAQMVMQARVADQLRAARDQAQARTARTARRERPTKDRWPGFRRRRLRRHAAPAAGCAA